MIRLTRVPLPPDLEAACVERANALRDLLARGAEPAAALLSAYRDPDLKRHLISEVNGKCMYCESKISHVYFGDIEHIRPKSAFPAERLDVSNLGLACAVCNGKKGDYWDATDSVLNPYVDVPAEEVMMLGFLLARRPGRTRARVTIEKLELNRPALLERRRERVELLQALADQYVQTPDGPVRELIKGELLRQAGPGSEYALVVQAYIEAACGLTI